MPIVFIDGIEYTIKPGRNMLEAALDHGLDLPYFCWHPAFRSIGACRQCAAKFFTDENDTKGKVMMACMTPAIDGTRMSITDPEAVEFRRWVIEWLMTNHPHDCPVCDEGGECHLQDMTAITGQVYRRFRGRKRTYENQYLGPFVNHEMNRCIQCYRCVRFYRDYAGGRDFDVFGSRNRTYFGRDKDGVLESEFSGNLVEVCPTGVLTDKTLMRHYTRKWDLMTAPSICIHCGLGCNTIPGARYNELRRVRARYNGDVNGYFLCDRGRYGYEFSNSPRRLISTHADAMDRARLLLKDAKGVIGIGSPRASLESNYALKKMVGDANFSTGLSAFDQECADLALSILRDGPARTPSLAEVEDADAILILGADPTNEAPMLDLAIRQAMRGACMDISRKLRIPDWDANAVANALQDARGKLYIAVPWRTKLAEIAVEAALLSYADMVRTDGIVKRATEALREADQPLVVTSISAGPEVLKAAANLARSLCAEGKDCRLSIIVPEANTMGVAMLGGMSVDKALSKIESGEADTVVVVENDLPHRTPLLKKEGSGEVESSESQPPVVPLRKGDRSSPTPLLKKEGPGEVLIALDCIETATTSKADLALPASTFFESDGTFVSSECRAQRFYQVFVPEGDMRQSWSLLNDLAGFDWATAEDVLRALAAEVPALAPALEAAPGSDYRSRADQKVARAPVRYTGRTAESANVSVFEPRPPDDPGTPFAFSMEGDQNPEPGAINPRFWWPGWNSVNSITKFQIEVNGPLHGGNPGKRLVEPSGTAVKPFVITPSPALAEGQLWILPRPRIFGSEELSRLSTAIGELIPPPDIAIHPDTAAALGIADGEMLEFAIDGHAYRLLVRLDDSVAPDVACVPAGYDETLGITAPVAAALARVK